MTNFITNDIQTISISITIFWLNILGILLYLTIKLKKITKRIKSLETEG
ncbi:MAG: hypothetical protein ACTSPA_05940 [Promethearchaeota archaeon]